VTTWLYHYASLPDLVEFLEGHASGNALALASVARAVMSMSVSVSVSISVSMSVCMSVSVHVYHQIYIDMEDVYIYHHT